MSKPLLRKLDIWSNLLQEETLCDGLSSVGLQQFSEQEKSESSTVKQQRGIESYSYKNKAFDERFKKPHSKPNLNRRRNKLSISSLIEGTIVSPDTTTCIQYDENKSRSHIRASELDTDQVVIKEIVSKLQEPNSDIISEKIVNDLICY